ncbi:thiamine diphosphokinase [uncultured Amaricoccus sp.]|uniref:thiamine diphosphokinase n=1 Tax=uncultured Amaricoccus sp. TaxID=339341 RepID=UPI002605F42A|nr:thiamine diphosphokinase [uncultured Amaricoccus sp.]
MIEPLLRAPGPVTLVGGGAVPPERLAAALALAPVVVGADGGGDVGLPPGTEFRMVIGDMDSLGDPAALRARGVALHEVAEQNSTDLEKCLYSIEAPLILGVGFLGGRLDHHLAAMNALVKYPGRRVVLIGREDLCFLCPPVFALEMTAGERVSLFPMGPVTGLVGEGLRWPVQGLRFAPDGRIGTSNAASGGRLRLGFDAPRMLVILPVGTLDAVAEQLVGPRPD